MKRAPATSPTSHCARHSTPLPPTRSTPLRPAGTAATLTSSPPRHLRAQPCRASPRALALPRRLPQHVVITGNLPTASERRDACAGAAGASASSSPSTRGRCTLHVSETVRSRDASKSLLSPARPPTTTRASRRRRGSPRGSSPGTSSSLTDREIPPASARALPQAALLSGSSQDKHPLRPHVRDNNAKQERAIDATCRMRQHDGSPLRRFVPTAHAQRLRLSSAAARRRYPKLQAVCSTRSRRFRTPGRRHHKLRCPSVLRAR